MTGADDNQDLGGNGFRDGEASGVPTLQARLGYRFAMWQGPHAEIAGWGHYAREKTEIPTGLSGRQDFTSEAVGLDLFVPIWKDIVSLKGEAWFGENLDDIRGGIPQGVNSALGEEIHSRGGWIELTLKPAKWYSIHGGFLTDDPEHTNLPAAGAAIGRDLNSVWYMAGRLYMDPIEFGLDYLNWTTYYADRIGKGQDNRFQASLTYKF